MNIDATWTVTATHFDGRERALKVSRHGIALAIQDAEMEDPTVVRCEIRDNITGLIKGRSKPAEVTA